MTIYIAAPYYCLSAMVVLAADLTRDGFTIRAQWLYGDPEDTEWRPEDALRDLADIEAVDAVLIYNPKDFWQWGTGGRHVELGYALALRKPVVVWGVRSNVFYTLPDLRVVEDREGLPGALQAVAESLESRIVWQ